MRALVIYNPAARGAPKLQRLRQAADGVAGWEITIEPTAAAGHATTLASRAASDGYEAVVACGGDGTVNEVANGLAGSAAALAVVRAGTANVWAKEASIPKDPRKALLLLRDGETRSVDLGRAGDRYFLLMAGIGFDAAIVRELAGGAKQRLGAAAYILAGLRESFRYKAVPAILTFDGGKVDSSLYWLMLGNTRNYGGVLNLTPMAKADDGRLEAILLQRGGLLRLTWLVPWVLLKRHHRRANVRHWSVAAAEIRTPGLPVQIDGEFLGETPLRFGVAPRALRVIVPRGTSSPLFSHPPL
jgi:YegS/Rv2252/BmrU family lipid kinase